MKPTRFLILLAVLAAVALRAASVTNYDSIVSLATNTTRNYTFTDTASGQSVVVAVAIAGYSPLTNNASLQALDGGTRIGGNYGNGFRDGSGVNFSVSLVSSSSGVASGSIEFRIVGLGIRAADGSGTVNWSSSASVSSVYLDGSAEIIQLLDTGTAALPYSAQLRFPSDGLMQLTDVPAPGQSIVLNASFTVTNSIDPRTNSWFTTYSGKYARIYTSDANKASGTSVTTWSTGSTAQSTPVFCGVQEIYSSSDWVYIRSSGLSSHIMGPWYLNAAHTQAFPNYPTNEHVLYRIPRTPATLTNKTANSGGAIGYFVDGVAMFNSWDAYSWNGTTNVQGAGNGSSWNRDAYVNEGVTFDPNNAHQAGGQHHYHANPPGLRYLLGDHVNFNSVSKAYTESTNTPTKHSPILGWVADGWPIYGPYGYSISNSAASGVRRMVSGYVLRNGQNGTDNLTNTVRANSPAWAVRLYGSNSPGPANLTLYPVGMYMEDNAWLGDLTNSHTGQKYAMGSDFDLDEYNGRWCITPEFPNGTYAYFVAISSNGAPVFPYNIGRGYYGDPSGTSVGGITEPVITNFLGGPNATPSLNPPAVKNGAVTLTWSATEGGTYRVESTTNFSTWTTNSTTVAAVLNSANYTNYPTDNARFYRVARTALAGYDSPGTGGYTPTLYSYSPGGSATRGTTVTVTNTLATPPPSPPLNAPLPTVTLAGTISGSNISHPATNIVVCTFSIPANAPIGSQNIVITFGTGSQPPPWTNTFTINP